MSRVVMLDDEENKNESDRALCGDGEDDEDTGSDLSWLDSETDRKCRKHPVCWLCIIAFAVTLGPFVISLRFPAVPDAVKKWMEQQQRVEIDKIDSVSVTTLALMIGFGKQQMIQSSVLVDIAFGLVFCGTLTATVIATLDPDAKGAPRDFLQKGTLSNMTQDMSQPQGRLWTTALGLASVLMVISMYTFWLYRSWAPFVDLEHNPLASSVLQAAIERHTRIAWALVPSVGFVLAALVPSLSDVRGYGLVLTAVHNVAAPLSMLLLMIMETIQLGYGENAFQYFFTNEPTPVYGPMTKYQRMRVCLLLEAWISGIIFISAQGYLGLRQNSRYWVALTSYYGEVIGIILAFSLPVAAAIDIHQVGSAVAGGGGSIMWQTAAVLPYIEEAHINETIHRMSRYHSVNPYIVN